MAIKITISQQMVVCDKQKTALVLFLAWERHSTQPLVLYFHSKNTLVQFSYQILE
jgi:hypothetical protein